MNNRFSKLLEQAKTGDAYWADKIVQIFTEELSQKMQQEKISKKDLAERLGTSPAYVTKVMRGNANFTVETMVKIANSLDMQLHLHLAPKETSVRWFNIFEGHANNIASYDPINYKKIDEKLERITA